jgi:hypothetical protein
MARQYGVQKVRLDQALAVVAALEPVSYSELVAELEDHFHCARRTAQDALSILRKGHFVETAPARTADRAALGQATGPSCLIDTRRRLYFLSDRGHYLLQHPAAPRLLRIARKLFTTGPSPNVRRFQLAAIARHGGLDEALWFFEEAYIESPAKLRAQAHLLSARFQQGATSEFTR